MAIIIINLRPKGSIIKVVFKKVIHNLFTKKITIAKWQLNLFGVILFSLGAVFGVGVLTNKLVLPGIFALNDTTKTWTFNTENAGNYTYDNALVNVDDSGAWPGVNKFTNAGFESDLTGWTVGPTINDTFDTLSGNWVAQLGTVGVSGGALQGATLAADGIELATNREFSVDTAGWTGIGGATLTRVDSALDPGASSGGADDWCLKVTSAGNAGAAGRVALTLVPGVQYRVSVRAYAPSTNTAVNVARFIWQGIVIQPVTAEDVWQVLSYTGAATASVNSLDLNCNSATVGDKAYFDAMSFQTILTIATLSSWTSPNGIFTYDLLQPATGVVPFGTVFRYTDNLNYWEVRVKPNTAETDTDIVEVVNGVKTTRASADVDWTAGQTDQMRVTLSGTAISVEQKKYGASDWTAACNYDTMATGGSSTNHGVILYGTGVNQLDNLSIAPVMTAARDTTAKYAGTASVKLIGDGNYTQSVNVGNTSTYTLTAYAYTTGVAVTSADLELYYDTGTISTSFTDMGSGWYRLQGALTGAAEAKDYGVRVKAGKTVKADDFTLFQQGTYSIYTTSAYSNSQVYTWDSFTPTVTASGNASVVYQLCTDDGSTCQTNNSWKYWNGSTWATATDMITTVNTAAQLTQTAMQALSVTSKKISVKAIMSFGGSGDTPILSSIAIGLTTTPSSLTLDSPSDNSYTNSERPTFRWKGASDSVSGLSKYVLEIDNPSAGTGQASGDFSLDSLPTNRTTDYETNKYIIHYENFSDSDSTNDYISAYTKSSTDWSTDSNSGQNDGKLREGKVSWKVRAVNNAGGETSSSRTLFVDRTNPKIELTQINSAPFSPTSFSTTDTTPIIYGKITDPLSGGDSSQTQDENGPKIASGPKQVEIEVEKKEGLGYKLHTLYTINMDKPWYTCDGKEVTDNSKQKCDKYLPFKYAPEQNLALGTYRITISGKDKADNSASETSFTLNITTLEKILTPQERKALEEEPSFVPSDGTSEGQGQEEVKEELEITKPQEPSALEKTIRGIGHTVQIGFNTIGQGAKFIFNTTGQALAFVGEKIGEGAKAIGDGYNNFANNAPASAAKTVLTAIESGVSATGSAAKNTGLAIASVTQKTINTAKGGMANITFKMGEKVQDVSDTVGMAIIEFGSQLVTEPTRISDVQAIAVSPTSAKVSWTTNHPANGKVNWGFEDGIYELEDQTDKRTTRHEFILTNLRPDTEYHYEVMSHNKNYVYDANRSFKTPSK